MTRIMDGKAVRFGFLVVSFFTMALGARSAQSYWSLAEAPSFTAPPNNVMFARTFIPPARKAILVDPQGLAHRTADNTALTYRDRSRLVRVPHYRQGADAAIYVAPNVQKDVISGAVRAERGIPAEEIREAREKLYAPESPAPPVLESRPAVEVPAAEPSRTDADYDALLVSRVHSAILTDDSLYITGMNLRVTANQGVVTLEGPVNSLAEKERIGSIAKKIAGRRQVVNRLNVLI
jgi:hypothetical protein